jgi:hypothetical protein
MPYSDKQWEQVKQEQPGQKSEVICYEEHSGVPDMN